MRLIRRFIPVVWCLIIMSMGVVMPIRAADAVVTDCINFTGAGTISQAVADANSGGGTISVTCTGTIIFDNELVINAAVIINNDSGGTVIFDEVGDNNRFFQVSGSQSLTLNGFTLQNGDITGDFGGAIRNNNASTLIINNSTFSNNSANDGGAIFNNGAVFINNSTFSDNSAGFGGAIRNFTIGSTLTITNSIFTDNLSANGGAIFVFSGSANSQNTHYVNNTCVGTVTNLGGNTNINSGGCPGSAPVGLSLSTPICNPLTSSMEFDILTGDGSTFAVTGTGAGVPPTMSIGTNTLPAQNQGPNTWNLTITETHGDRQSVPISITCNVTLSADAMCIGNDLRVNILTGDPTFDILDDNIAFRDDVSSLGATLITGPVSTTNLRVREDGGDTQILPLTDQNCFTSETLSASATCDGANLELVIGNGNSPFRIDVNGNVTTGNPIGVYPVTGPNTFTVIVTEEGGDGETYTASVTCNATVIPPALPPAPAPIVTVLGCALDTSDGLEIANAPDNTYCRVLMRNGGVVGYSGAVPRELIALGVILAVDVYRLEGGASVNTFPDYARVCLAGTGRLFYMDGRNAPRVSIALQSETEGNLTCGWIPAPGTLILTN